MVLTATFRGYCNDTKSWVIGYLGGRNIIIRDNKIYIVQEDSVAIWTGFFDSRGMKIFVNDILKTSNNNLYKVLFQLDGFKVEKLDEDSFTYQLTDFLHLKDEAKVVGIDYIDYEGGYGEEK